MQLDPNTQKSIIKLHYQHFFKYHKHVLYFLGNDLGPNSLDNRQYLNVLLNKVGVRLIRVYVIG